jgi:hypothetical protein
MATTTNYSWSTPDDSALVKDGASAIRSLGTAIDTTTKNLNPSTTLGDIEYRSSTANTNTRLGIGTTGQVLTVAGGVPSWATPAGGGGNWTLLNSGGTALTGAATVTVSGISAKEQIMVLVKNFSATGAYSSCGVRFNTDSANHYQYGFLLTTGASGGGGSYNTRENEGTAQLGRITSDPDALFSGFLIATGCNSSGVKSFICSGGPEGLGTAGQMGIAGGYYNSASTISSITIVSNIGDLDGGTVFVYTSAN